VNVFVRFLGESRNVPFYGLTLYSSEKETVDIMMTKIFYSILCMLVCTGFRSMAQSGHIQKEMENGTVSFVRFSTDTASQPLSKSMEVFSENLNTEARGRFRSMSATCPTAFYMLHVHDGTENPPVRV
jgi:hypothetical protein